MPAATIRRGILAMGTLLLTGACVHRPNPGIPGATFQLHAITLPERYYGYVNIPAYTFFVPERASAVRDRALSALVEDTLDFVGQGGDYLAARSHAPDEPTTVYVTYRPDGTGTQVAVGSIYVLNRPAGWRDPVVGTEANEHAVTLGGRVSEAYVAASGETAATTRGPAISAWARVLAISKFIYDGKRQD